MKQHKKISLKTKFIIGITIVGLCITSATVLSGIRIYRNSIIERYNDTAYQVAQTAASYFTEEELAYYADLAVRSAGGEAGAGEVEEAENSSRYMEVSALVDTLRENMQVDDILFCVFDMDELTHYDEEKDAAGDWNPLYYIMDSYKEADKRMKLGDRGAIFPEYCEDIADSYYSGVHADNYFVAEGQFGYTTSAIYPIVRNGKTAAFAAVEVPMSALQSDTNRFIIRIAAAAVLVTAVLLIAGSLFMVRTMAAPIRLVAAEAERFIADNNAVSKKLSGIKTRDEIQTLAESLLKLEIDINEYIENLTKVTAEKERIGAELNVATQIQADMLPSIFPAFPDRKEFDIYATMTPAKEVGGDFYDFFLIDDDHLALVMADVSGKGVPAALFMVIAKTLIKNRAQMAADGVYSPADILGYVNNQLCEGNEAELFVTVWLGILQISTGKGTAANAGHEYPVVRRAGGVYELIKTKNSPAVAAMEGMRFREHAFELHAGDSLYVYTDGVPEATDAGDELFGTDRMLAALNENPEASTEELLHTVKRHIDAFVGEAPQFDDITMLCLHYSGGSADSMKELEVDAKTENLEQVLDFVNGELDAAECPKKVKMKIDIAVEEIFVNIAHYAYPDTEGKAVVRMQVRKEPAEAEIIFMDWGTPYNPLEKSDPDVTLSAEERQIGGLGIYMVKKSMNHVSYEYKDGKNILNIKKSFNTGSK